MFFKPEARVTVFLISAISADVLKKFHVLYAKQFGYTTKAEQAVQDEENRKKNEELAKKRAERAKEKEKLEEERKKREAEKEAARKVIAQTDNFNFILCFPVIY